MTASNVGNTITTPGCGGNFITTTSIVNNEVIVETFWVTSEGTKLIGSTTFDPSSIATEHITRYAFCRTPQFVE